MGKLFAFAASLFLVNSVSLAMNSQLKKWKVSQDLDDVDYLKNFDEIGIDNGKFHLLYCESGDLQIINNKSLKEKVIHAYKNHGIKRAQFSSSGEKIITTSVSGVVKIWNLDGSLLARFEDSENPVDVAVFGQNDNEIFTFSRKNIYKVWKMY